MSHHQRGGYGLSATPARTYQREETAPAGGSFAEMRANPVRGPFVMPANAQIAIYAPCGSSGNYPLVTLTAPDDGTARFIDRVNLNPGGRTVISGVLKAGTLVEAAPGLEVQVSVGPLEWATVAVG